MLQESEGVETRVDAETIIEEFVTVSLLPEFVNPGHEHAIRITLVKSGLAVLFGFGKVGVHEGVAVSPCGRFTYERSLGGISGGLPVVGQFDDLVHAFEWRRLFLPLGFDVFVNVFRGRWASFEVRSG